MQKMMHHKRLYSPRGARRGLVLALLAATTWMVWKASYVSAREDTPTFTLVELDARQACCHHGHAPRPAHTAALPSDQPAEHIHVQP